MGEPPATTTAKKEAAMTTNAQGHPITRPQNWQEVADQVMSTSMSVRAQADQALAEANGEPQYMSPSEAHGRLVKTDPIGMKPVMLASLFSGKAYWWGHMAMLLQAQQMPGPWFGDRPMTEAEKAAGLQRAPRLSRWNPAALWLQVPVALIGWVVTDFYFSAQATGFAWIAMAMAIYMILWIEYYARRTNRKEVVFASGIFFGLFRLGLGALSGDTVNKAQRVYEGKYNDNDYSRGYDPALIAQMEAEQRAANQSSGTWNPLDYGA